MTGPPAWVEPPLEPNGPAERGSKLFGQRAFLVSTASTLVFFGVVTLIVVLSPGFDAVRRSFFDLDAMRASFFGVPSEGLPPIWRGFLLNVEVFLVAEVLILILALALAVIRQIPGPVFFPFRLVAIVYTDLFRGTPLLNDFVSLQKDTALLAVLGTIEAVRSAEIYTNYRFNYSPYVITAFLFILLTIPLARFTDHLIERDRRRRSAGFAR